MRLIKIKVFALIILALAPASLSVYAQPPKSSNLESAGRYMTQTYVDTTVLRAFYVLNATSSQYSGNTNRQQQAVNQAKRILADLRQQAKGDPNERYALMKIQEVEAQIFLEEEEMRRIMADRNILEANKLVIQYNGEVANPRPDFRTLRGLYLRMAEVDSRQANRLADSYNKRHRAVSREALHSLEKAVNAKDYNLATRELEYLDKNKNYLLISSSQLDAYRERLGKLSGANTDLPRIISELESGERAYKEYRLSESRTSLTLAQNHIREIRANLQEREANNLTARAGRAIRALDNREDSLVRVALSVLDIQGPDAAIEYFNDVLQRRMQMSQERSAIVDQAILSARPDLALKLDSKIKLVEIDDQPNNSHESLSLIQDRARYRAQERADSIRAVKGRAAGISLNIYTLIDNKKLKDAGRAFNREKAFLTSVLEKAELDLLTRSIQNGTNLSTPAGAKNMERAEMYKARIYKLIEERNTKEATQRFRKYRKPLQKYLDAESYRNLEVAVNQSAKKK